jgi:hypothetical protein
MCIHFLVIHDPVSENFVSWCQTLKNSSASFLCIQETYFISTISQFESDYKNVYIWSAFVYDVWTTDFVR